MKFSKSLIRTFREAPAEAEVVSHSLLIRAGMIRKVAAGIYEFLPLGLRSLRKVEDIIRFELDQAGCQEVLLPHLVPAEFWIESERWEKYGKELLRIKDRHDREYCFGPTHEETMCDMVRANVNSYKSFPFNLYQIQTKFRDEIRPRFGLMRGREFIMKDGYSFHTSLADLDREYDKMYQTYSNIFARCGLDSRVVEADSGAIGGSSSHEFMVMADTGEDLIACCQTCDYAANIEKATSADRAIGTNASVSAIQDAHTPNLKTVSEVSRFLNIGPRQMIKTLIYKVDDHFVAACLAGDREVSDVKIRHAIEGAEIRMATDEEVLELTGVPVGFLGPVGLENMVTDKKSCPGFEIIYDHTLMGLSDLASGANRQDYHIVHINLVRDLGLKHERQVFKDFSNVVAGDVCPGCQDAKLILKRGIEVGHIFKLGDRYSKPMKVVYLDQNGKEQCAIMGTYGIGVGRTLAASVEQSHDDKGIVWPKALAPFDIHLMTLDTGDDVTRIAEELYQGLQKTGLDVLWDDRDDRAGVKFNDADLIGIPLQVIIGNRGLKSGSIEYKIRSSAEKGQVALDSALEGIKKVYQQI